MAAEHGEDIEMEDLPGDIDYDLEYLVRNRYTCARTVVM